MSFDAPNGKKMHFENIVGKGENVGKQHFLLFPHCFLTYERKFNVLNNSCTRLSFFIKELGPQTYTSMTILIRVSLKLD